MKKFMIMASSAVIGQIHFACMLAGLTVAQVIPDELIGKLEEHHQEPCELELMVDLFSGYDVKEAAQQIIAYGSMVNRAVEHERMYGYSLPPTVPKQIGNPCQLKLDNMSTPENAYPDAGPPVTASNMTRKRLNQIEALASSTLLKANAYSLPVDLSAVARLLGIELIGFDFGDEVTGCLLRHDDGRVCIGYNDQMPTRSVGRFAIAHSMGHQLLEHFDYAARPEVIANYYTIFSISRLDHKTCSALQQEREANTFAAALLMPADLVQVAIQTCAKPADYLGSDILLSVADTCQVSPQLMALRMSTLCAIW